MQESFLCAIGCILTVTVNSCISDIRTGRDLVHPVNEISLIWLLYGY